MSNIVEKMRDTAILEKNYAEKLRELSKKLKHPVLRGLFHAVAYDSEKHAMLYEVLSELLASTQPMISEEDLEFIVESVEEHIRLESEMIEFTRKLLEETADPRLKLVLSAILDDEINHHRILVDIRDKIARRETFTEEDFWNMVWKDSPYHGAPGG